MRNYDMLRAEHARAVADLSQHIEQSESPERQDGREQSPEVTAEQDVGPQRPERGPSPGWTGAPGLVNQQGSANKRHNWLNADIIKRDRAAIENTPTEAERLNSAAGERPAELDRGGDSSHDTAKNELNHYIDGAERSDGPTDFRAAAHEALDRHIESPEQQKQPDIQQQHDIDIDR